MTNLNFPYQDQASSSAIQSCLLFSAALNFNWPVAFVQMLQTNILMRLNKPSAECQQRHLEKNESNYCTHDNLARGMEVSRSEVALDGNNDGQDRDNACQNE